MDGIICYTPYLPEGKERDISFLELLLDENWAEGTIKCQEKVYSDVGDMNRKLEAKQNYEFLLRAVQKYPLKAIGVGNGSSAPGFAGESWNEFRADCYIAGKYQKELAQSGYYPIVIKDLMAKALRFAEAGKAAGWLNEMISHGPEYDKINGDTSPILIYQHNDFCRHVPASFAEGLAEALRVCRQRVILCDVVENEAVLAQFAGQRFKAVVGIQTQMFLSAALDGYFHDLLDGPKYNMILDHPIGLRKLFENHPDNYYALVHDRNYQRFIKSYWPGVKDCFCFPPGGIQPSIPLLEWGASGNCKNWHEVKTYDVIFMGSYPNYRDFLRFLYSLQGSVRIFAARFLDVMRRNPNDPAEKALKQALGYYGISLAEDDFLNLLEMFRHVVDCISSYYREKIIRMLLDAGIEIHVYGDSWNRASFAGHKCLVRHQGMDVEESLNIMEQAKISLNIMSWHKDGFTERVLNSMLAGAVALSDRSTHLEEKFVDGEDIILFDLARLGDLPGRVRELLSDEEKLRAIAEKGRKRVMEEHLWIHRAKEFLKIISKNS